MHCDRASIGLLAAHDLAGSFLLSPPEGLDATAVFSVSEQPGTEIGPYKLLQQIGEGGFGVVFMAEQERPIRRKVALKIIKPGMDTREVVARFEAERQALALMEHVNIARVLDAGATSSGLPYFVMELVRGIPITEYCDQNNLPLSKRLELIHSGLPGRAARASKRRHSPRHQAVECAGHAARRRAGSRRSSTSASPRRSISG